MPPEQTPEETRPEVIRPQEANGNGRGQGALVHYQAPLPLASEFERYERAVAGSGDRIIGMAERQSKHRHFIEKVVVVLESLKSFLGLFCALGIVIAGLIGGIYLIMHDKSTQGYVAMIVPLFTVAASFLFQETRKKPND